MTDDLRTYEQAQAALQAAGAIHVASPPSACLNGCHDGHGADRVATETEGASKLCRRCIKHLNGWLRVIPDSYALLPLVVTHGSVETNPESAHIAALEAAAPLRLEIRDLLDHRHVLQYDDSGQPLYGDNRRGVFGVVLGWAGRIRIERHLPRSCDCGHDAPLHRWSPPFASLCRANCECVLWSVRANVAGECAFIGQHLAYVTEQDWVADLYAELKPLSRQLSDAVGDYRPAAIGMCLAMVPARGLLTDVICGGPLYRDEDEHGVRCARCGDATDLDTLQRLGISIGILSDNGNEHQEAS